MTEWFRVLILGYGEMGHAMEHLLKGRQQLDIREKCPKDNFQSAVLADYPLLRPIHDIVRSPQGVHERINGYLKQIYS